MEIAHKRAVALTRCTMLPGSWDKRFARDVSIMENLTEKQILHIERLAWKYRRQMPNDLVPKKDAS